MTLDDILWNYTRYMGLYMVNIPYYGIYPMIYGMQYGLDNWEITNDSTAEIDGWNSMFVSFKIDKFKRLLRWNRLNWIKIE